MKIEIIYSRVLCWHKFFRAFTPLKFRGWFALLLSSLLEIMYSFIAALLNLHMSNPRLWPKGLYSFRCKDSSVVFVRGGTEDLYNMLPFREGDVEMHIRKIHEGDVFIDVGANVGYYSLLASKLVGKYGRVIAIECIPQTAAILKINLCFASADNVILIDKAAWSSRTRLQMLIPRGFYGQASAVGLHKGSIFDKVEVEAISLDEIIESLNIHKIKMLKIDVEGSELQVLEGGRKTLKKTKYIIVEISKNAKPILQLLRGASFKIRRFNFPNYIFAYACRSDKKCIKFL